MRNKIKQLLKKEGGFTLVELLGVIVILGLIVAISIPLIGNVIDGAEQNTIDAQKELVMDAAQMYEIENDIPTSGITSTKLAEEGYLEEQGQDATVYTVTKTGNKYTIAP